jgi:hypothetical protein
MIGQAQRAAIAELKTVAAAKPFDARAAIDAARQHRAAYHDMMNTMSIVLPIGYHVTYSHEIQPTGLMQHISISVERGLPAPEAVNIILDNFGMRPARESEDIWLESLADGIKAVNILQGATA